VLVFVGWWCGPGYMTEPKSRLSRMRSRPPWWLHAVEWLLLVSSRARMLRVSIRWVRG
jgi:hypothetical protein